MSHVSHDHPDPDPKHSYYSVRVEMTAMVEVWLAFELFWSPFARPIRLIPMPLGTLTHIDLIRVLVRVTVMVIVTVW